MKKNDEAVCMMALERLFAAELAAALDVPISAVAGHRDTLPVASRARWGKAAAVLLFGVIMTWLVAVQHASAPAMQGPEELEAPDPLPIPYVQHAADIAKLTKNTRSLGFTWEVGENDLSSLTPLTALVRLRIFGPLRQDVMPPDLLDPIAALPEVEVLELPLFPGMTGKHLRQLAAAPKLRFLSLQLHRRLSIADIEALQALPKLCSLSLQGGRIDAGTVRALSLLPTLDRLELSGVGGCTEVVLQELRTLHRLRRLGLTGLGKQPCAERLGETTDDDSVGLSPAVAKALAELPLLAEVALSHCAVTSDAIRALPPRLTSFSLTRCPDAGADVVAALEHFPHLQRLGLDHFDRGQRRHWRRAPPPPELVETGPPVHDPVIESLPDQGAIHRAQAELLRRLPIARLCYNYSLPDEVAATLPEATKLTTIELTWGVAADIASVAKAPALARLRLSECSFGIDDLQALKDTPLRRLDQRWGRVSREAAAAALPGVTVGDD
jgi:hypothetical protein